MSTRPIDYPSPTTYPQTRTSTSRAGLLHAIAAHFQDAGGLTIVAGIALYALITVPALTLGTIAIYGSVASPEHVIEHVNALSSVVPPSVIEFLRSQMVHAVRTSGAMLTATIVFAIALALFSAQRSVSATMLALNRAYGLDGRRSFWSRHALAVALAAGLLILIVGALLAFVAMPQLTALFGLQGVGQTIAIALRWPVAFVIGTLALMVFNRAAPSTRIPWTAALFGAVLASTLWLLGSFGLSYYVAHVSALERLYGAAAGLLVTIFWFYLGAFAVLLGAIVAMETRWLGR